MSTWETILAVGLFIIGLLCLIKGGDWFVDSAVDLAKRFKIPEIIIGATIVSIGTTLPEVMVSSTAAVQGQSATAYGNAIGSVICNTALISALTIAIAPMAVSRKTFMKPVFWFFGAAILYAGIAYATGNFSRLTGIILLLGFVGYMTYTIITGFRKKEGAAEGVLTASETLTAEQADAKEEDEKEVPLWRSIVMLLVGAAVIAVGAKLLVDNGTKIAVLLGVPESVIALTFVALGTSLPELVTAITSLVKGHGSLSLGNIIGANLFNLVLVSGMAITLRPFAVPVEKTIAGMNASLVVDIPVMFLVMGIMTIPSLISQKLQRWQGILLLALYTGYVVFQFFI